MSGERRLAPHLFDGPPSRPADLLSEERTAARRSFFRRLRLSPWPSGRAGLAVLAVAAIGGLGLALFGPESSGDPGFGGPEALRVSEGRVHPEAGRPLAGPEVMAALPFGEPLELGPGGNPLFRHAATGEVRELTPVELEFARETAGSGVPFLPAAEAGVVWAPGPRGWGLWWSRESYVETVRPSLFFNREGWLKRQEDELRHAAGLLRESLAGVAEMEFDPWRRGVGLLAYYPLRELRSRHSSVLVTGQWSMVPYAWVCHPEIESGLSRGVSNGCPPPGLSDAFADAWYALGWLADGLYGVARLAVAMDALSLAALYDSGLLQQQVAAVTDLQERVEVFLAVMDELSRYGAGLGYPLDLMPEDAGVAG